MGKKTGLAVVLLVVLAGGGYYMYWFKTAKKLEDIVVENISKINNKPSYSPLTTKVHVEKIVRSGFPLNIKLVLHNVTVKNSTTLMNESMNDFKSNNPDVKNNPDVNNNQKTNSESSVWIEEMQIQSDIGLKKFITTNNKGIKFENDKQETFTVDYKPQFITKFKKSIAINQDLWTYDFKTHMDNLQLVQYKDNGYKVFDSGSVLKSECLAKNMVQVKNHSNETNYDINLMIDFHNKNNKKDGDTNGIIDNPEDRKSMEFFVYSDLTLNTNFKSERNKKDSPQLFHFDIKKFDWDFQNGGIKIDGLFNVSDRDFVPIGKINHTFINYMQLLNDVENAFSIKDSLSYTGFLRKILPEIANETSNNDADLKVIYLREKDKPTMIGTKTLEEVESEYIKYFTSNITTDDASKLKENDKLKEDNTNTIQNQNMTKDIRNNKDNITKNTSKDISKDILEETRKDVNIQTDIDKHENAYRRSNFSENKVLPPMIEQEMMEQENLMHDSD